MEPAPYLASCKSRTWEPGALRQGASGRPQAPPAAMLRETETQKKRNRTQQTHPPTSQSPVCRMSEHCSGESRVPRAGGHAETKLFAYCERGRPRALGKPHPFLRHIESSPGLTGQPGSRCLRFLSIRRIAGPGCVRPVGASPRGTPEPPDRGHSAGRSSSAVGATERRLGPSAPRARPTTRLAAGGMSGRGAARQVGGPRARRPPARPPQARPRTAAFSGGPFWARLKPCRPPARVSSAPSF